MAAQAAQTSDTPDSCCICSADFTTLVDLAAHLIRHAEDSEYQDGLEDNGILYEEPVSQPTAPSKSSYPEYTTTSFVNTQGLERSSSSRSESPIVLEIDSDSDDDTTKPISRAPPAPAVIPNNTNLRPGRPRNYVGANMMNQSNNRQLLVQKSGTQMKLPYTCRVCDRKFNDPKLFRDHLLTHEKPRPFSCHICNKSFAYRGTLRQHLRMHIGEKLHQCPKCNKRFTIQEVLYKHCKEVHGITLTQK